MKLEVAGRVYEKQDWDRDGWGKSWAMVSPGLVEDVPVDDASIEKLLDALAGSRAREALLVCWIRGHCWPSEGNRLVIESGEVNISLSLEDKDAD